MSSQKLMKRILSITLLVLMVIGMTGCKNKTNPSSSPSVNMPSIEDSDGDDAVAIRTPASQIEQDWFNNILRDYIQEELGTENFYLSTNVYDVKGEINASNALTRASAMITLCVDSDTINKDKASSFSDNLAKKFAVDKATGEITFSIYRIPHDTYIQVTDTNYNTAIKESAGTEGYSKFSFNYAGTGNVILDSPSKVPSAKPSDEPSTDVPSTNNPSAETPSKGEIPSTTTEPSADGTSDVADNGDDALDRDNQDNRDNE